MSLLFALLFASGLSPDASPTDTTAATAPPPTPAAPCATAESRQFDFWLGEWEVTNPKGKRAGHSRIESILGGCAIQEHWQGAGGSNGTSLNLYNAASGQWEQFWVDNGASRLHLVGGRRDGAMVLEGRQDKPDAKTGIVQRERITWTPNADGSVRQLWETSTDEGKTWTVSFDGRYRRVGAGG